MICIANWKMQMTYKSAKEFLKVFKTLASDKDKKSCIFLPSAQLSSLFEQEDFLWGAQNICPESQGAFTGENSAQVLKERGGSYCLLGHSERRLLFKETNEDIEKKFRLACKLGLIPVLCLGEQDKDQDFNQVLSEQLGWLKQDYPSQDFYLAYEPVWAIGTGETCKPEQMQSRLELIRKYLQKDQVKILYGGSVKPENVSHLCSEFVQGFLVGGASLKAQDFYQVYTRSKA